MNTVDEYFYVVNEDDKVIGKATREECHSNPRLIHRSIYIFVLNDQNEVFIQKRSMSKDLYPGYYTGSATGHVDYGETYDSAAKRELKEELGIEAPLQKLGKFISSSEFEREISALYLCRFNGSVKFNPQEITEGAYMSIDEIKRNLDSEEKKFAEGFKEAFKELLKHIR
jgi:isopentenyl-diphosphate delta-isomerase type 1